MSINAALANDCFQAPVGLDAVKKVVCNICENATMYQKSGSSPGHYIIDLDAGNGQSTLTGYIAHCFSKYRIRQFSGFDHFLEYHLDGTTDNLKQVFRDIRNQAVWTNEYEGIVAFDVGTLAENLDDRVSFFLEQIRNLCASITFIFYVPAVATRNTVSLVERIKKTIDDVTVVHVDPYTVDEIVEIIARFLDNSGVALDEESIDEAGYYLTCVASEKNIKTIKEAKRVANYLIRHADYEPFTPYLPNAVLKAMVAEDTDIKAEGK